MIDGGSLVFSPFSRDLPKALLPAISQALLRVFESNSRPGKFSVKLQRASDREWHLAQPSWGTGAKSGKGSGTGVIVLCLLAGCSITFL